MRRQQPERKLPNDPAFRIGELVKFVHHNDRNVVERENRRVRLRRDERGPG